jgi:hypothetical protein
MDRVEENIRRLLDGRALEDSQDLCDFTLEEQNEATGNLKSRYRLTLRRDKSIWWSTEVRVDSSF